jgi:Na+/melibiose symporter-like transporter
MHSSLLCLFVLHLLARVCVLFICLCCAVLCCAVLCCAVLCCVCVVCVLCVFSGFTFCGYRIGRRHSWYLGGTLLVLANFFFVFGICLPCVSVTPTPDSSILTIYYCVAAALFNVGWACVQVSHMSLVPSLSSIESERILLNSKRYAFTVMSNLFVFFILTVLIYFINMRDKKEQFHVLAYVCMGVGLFTSFVFFAGTLSISNKKEQEEKEQAELLSGEAHESGGEEEEEEDNNAPHNLSSIVAEDRDHNRSKASHLATGSVNDGFEAHQVFVSSSFSSHQSDSTHSTDSSGTTSHATTPTSDEENTNSLSPASTPSPVNTNSNNTSSSSSSSSSVFSWTSWFKVASFYTVGFIYMMSRLIVNVSQVFLPFYVLDALHFPLVMITAVPATCYLASFVAANYMKRINQRFGRRRTYVCGALLSIVASVAFFFLPKDPVWLKFLIFIPALLLGFGNG